MTEPTIQEEAEAFPSLSDAQIQRLRRFSSERTLRDGETLWEAGDRNRPLYVILEGQVEIRTGNDHVVTVHLPGAFTGDVDLLSGKAVVVSARALGATRLLELPGPRLRELVQTDPELSEIFLRAFIKRRVILVQQGGKNVTVIGSRHCARTHGIREFLNRNSMPYAYLDLDDDPSVQQTLEKLSVGLAELPVVLCRGDVVLRQPTIEQVARCLGMDEMRQTDLRDLVIIGAGPAGLSAAVYAASEGLDVLVVEARSPGGQAGSSSRIENYLGFPTGISGQKLANNAFIQAEKFGTEFAVARTAVRLDCGRPYSVDLGEGTVVRARSIVIASGVRYRKPDIANLSQFEGIGIYYGATPMEAALCKGEDVVVVGGGNSAGQAAVFLSEGCRRVTVMVRGPGLAHSMSRYLIRRLQDTSNITLQTGTRIVGLEGTVLRLERVRWRDGDGRETTSDIGHVFLMTGADPNTAWLQNCVVTDDKGYVRTGSDLGAAALADAGWPLSRPPGLFETSRPGVFAIGDVRAGSVKRVAAAVGEGSVCIQLVHKSLAEPVA
jgi:thioredoxin reductase (NADPH)